MTCAASAQPSHVQLKEMNVNILLVEDEELIRFTAAEFMRERGHSVTVAASAERAMEILRRWSTDVLVTDVGLPGTSGDVFAADEQVVARSEFEMIRRFEGGRIVPFHQAAAGGQSAAPDLVRASRPAGHQWPAGLGAARARGGPSNRRPRAGARD